MMTGRRVNPPLITGIIATSAVTRRAIGRQDGCYSRPMRMTEWPKCTSVPAADRRSTNVKLAGGCCEACCRIGVDTTDTSGRVPDNAVVASRAHSPFGHGDGIAAAVQQVPHAAMATLAEHEQPVGFSIVVFPDRCAHAELEAGKPHTISLVDKRIRRTKKPRPFGQHPRDGGYHPL